MAMSRRKLRRKPRVRRKVERAARRIAAKLLKLRANLRRILTQADRGAFLGWDTILDRTENAILKSGCAGAFCRALAAIRGLRRRYEGCKMPVETAVEPAWSIIGIIERDLKIRRR